MCLKDLQSALSTLDWAVSIDPESTEAWQAIGDDRHIGKGLEAGVKRLGGKRASWRSKGSGGHLRKNGPTVLGHFQDHELARDAYAQAMGLLPDALDPILAAIAHHSDVKPPHSAPSC